MENILGLPIVGCCSLVMIGFVVAVVFLLTNKDQRPPNANKETTERKRSEMQQTSTPLAARFRQSRFFRYSMVGLLVLFAGRVAYEYVGAKRFLLAGSRQIEFGMSEEEVEKLIGPPLTVEERPLPYAKPYNGTYQHKTWVGGQSNLFIEKRYVIINFFKGKVWFCGSNCNGWTDEFWRKYDPKNPKEQDISKRFGELWE